MRNFIAKFMNKFNKPKRIESKKEKRKRKRGRKEERKGGITERKKEITIERQTYRNKEWGKGIKNERN